MKTSQNLNNTMHAHDSLIILCEAYPLIRYEAYPRALYEAYPRIIIIMGLTLELSLLWAYPQVILVRLTLELYAHALCFIIQTL